MEEVWKPIKGYKFYQVSNFGRVRSLDRKQFIGNRWGGKNFCIRKGRILKPRIRSGGYVAVCFTKGGKDYPIHHLVLEAFVAPRPKGYTANHKNGIKTDNTSTNLEWMTYKENRQHALHNGFNRTNKGQKWKQLSTKEILEIRELYGKILSRNLAKKFKVSQVTIRRVGLRQTFKNI